VQKLSASLTTTNHRIFVAISWPNMTSLVTVTLELLSPRDSGHNVLNTYTIWLAQMVKKGGYTYFSFNKELFGRFLPLVS
jgi:hypothetical protein